VGVEVVWLRNRMSDLGCRVWWGGMGGRVLGTGLADVGSGNEVLGSLVVSDRSKSRLNMGGPNDPKRSFRGLSGVVGQFRSDSSWMVSPCGINGRFSDRRLDAGEMSPVLNNEWSLNFFDVIFLLRAS
jgi:hypothetical protein